MANENKTFLDLAGLTAYDTAIKNWSNGANQAGYKKIIQDGDNYKLYKDPDAVSTDTPDATINVNGAGAAAKTVYITETAGSSSDLYSKRYGIYQGSSGSAASPVVGEKLADIDIPKDMVVESGSVVDIVFKASDSTLHEGSESGTDVTADIVGAGGTATEANAGKYIKLIIANATSTKIFIKVDDLVDIYTVEQNAAEVQLAIDNSNVISASIVAVDGADVSYKAESSAGAGDAESVKAALTRLDGTGTGSISAKISSAIEDLATTSDVGIASYTAGTSGAADVITLTGSIKEEDGVVEAGTADTITLSTITATEINALFS